MSTTQSTLREFATQYDWNTVDHVTTIVLHLEQPTKRKQKRLDKAIDSARDIRVQTAQRLPSIPRYLWSKARPGNSLYYDWAKEMDSHLANTTVHENIQRVRETYASWQANSYEGTKPSIERFKNNAVCSFYHKQPNYEVHNDSYYVSLPLAAGRGERELVPLRDGDYIRSRVDEILDETVSTNRADLIRENSAYRLHQSIKREVKVIQTPQTAVGVDLGLANLAAIGAINGGTKRGADIWSGSETAQYRNQYRAKRKHLQEDTRLQKIRDEEHRFVDQRCHEISRQVIDAALSYDRPQIVMEDLTDIRRSFVKREREFTNDLKQALHSWPFRKLQEMIEYKAIEAGMPVSYIDPEYTSQRCNECGTVDSKSRDGIHFRCTECGYTVNADINAAFNIAQRARNNRDD